MSEIVNENIRKLRAELPEVGRNPRGPLRDGLAGRRSVLGSGGVGSKGRFVVTTQRVLLPGSTLHRAAAMGRNRVGVDTATGRVASWSIA